MPHFYVRGGGDSDLTVAGAIFNKFLRQQPETSVDQQVDVPGGGTLIGYAFTESGWPSTTGSHVGDYIVELDVPTGHANINISVNVARVSATGAVQSESSYSATQSGSSGQYEFVLNNVNLGAWAVTDRLRVGYRFVNTNAMNFRSVVVAHGSDFNEVTAPFDHPPELVTGLQTTSVAETSVGLSWNTEPNSDSYDIYTTRQGPGGMEFFKSDVGVTDTIFTVTGLAGGTYYEFAVRGVGNGAGPYSAPVGVTTSEPPVQTLRTITDSVLMSDGGSWESLGESDPVNIVDSVTYTKGSAGVTNKTGSDGLTLGLSESRAFGTVSVARPDSIVTSLTESRSLHTSRSRPDSLSVSVVETSQVIVSGLVQKQAADNMSVSFGYGKTNTVSVSHSDGLLVGLVETYSFTPRAVTSGDTLTASVIESAGFGAVAVVSSDSLSVSVQTSRMFSTVSVGAADSLSLSAVESRALLSSRTTIDGLHVGINEVGVVAVSGMVVKQSSDSLALAFGYGFENTVNVARVDNLTAGLTETRQFGVQQLSSNDQAALAVSESYEFDAVSVVAADNIPLAFIESAELFIARMAIETLNASVTELSQREISGTLIKQSSDNLGVTVGYGLVSSASLTGADNITVGLTEQQQFSVVTVLGSDSLAVAANDWSALQLGFGVIDQLSAGLTEQSALLVGGVVERSATDILTVGIGSSVVGTVAVAATDSLTLDLVESRQFDLVPVSATDSTWLATAETSVRTVSLSRVDQANVTLVEFSVVGLARSVADVVALELFEASEVVKFGEVTKNASDDLVTEIIELSQASVSFVSVQSSDAFVVTIGTSVNGHVTHVSVDGLTVTLEEASGFGMSAVPVVSADELLAELHGSANVTSFVARDITVVISAPQTRPKHVLSSVERRTEVNAPSIKPKHELSLLQNRPRATITLEARVTIGSPVVDRS